MAGRPLLIQLKRPKEEQPPSTTTLHHHHQVPPPPLQQAAKRSRPCPPDVASSLKKEEGGGDDNTSSGPWFCPGLVESYLRSQVAPSAHTWEAGSIQGMAVPLNRTSGAGGSTTWTYAIHGRGYRVTIKSQARGQVMAHCTCPFTDLPLNRLCKHSYAMALLLVDPQEEQRKRARQEEARVRAEQVRVQQEEAMPGERARLDYVLKTAPAKEVVEWLCKHVATSVEGLERVAAALPVSHFPGARRERCGRCNTDYDPHYHKDQCRIPHPEEEVERTYKDSRHAEFSCNMCGHSWSSSCYSYDGWGSDGETGWCFQGNHDPNYQGSDDEDDDDGDWEEEDDYDE